MSHRFFTALAVASIVLRTDPAGAQSTVPVIRTHLDTAVMQVGDRIHLTVEITHAASERVLWPDSLALDPFELLDARLGEPVAVGQRITSSVVYTLTAFELGALELPSFDVVVEGDGTDTVATDGWSVSVESVGLDEGGDIRDVKGPLGIPRNWILLWPWGVGAVLLGALALWAYRRYRRRARPVVAAPRVPSRPPHERALEALAALERSGLLDRGAYKEYHIRVSDVLRTYLEGRFGIDAMEMVTEEVVDRLRDLGLDSRVVDTSQRFLAACDLVKFAKHTPTPEASRQMVPTAREVVEVTRPASRPSTASAA